MPAVGGRAGVPVVFRRPAAFRDTEAKVAAGFVAVVAGCFAAALVSPQLTGQRAAVLAVVVAVFGAAAGDVLAGLATAGMAWLFCNGFLVGRLGELHWHGRGDAVRLVAFCAAGLAGAAAGWSARWVGSARRRWATALPSAAAGPTRAAAEPAPLPPGVPANARIVPSPAVHRGAPALLEQSTIDRIRGVQHG